MRYRVLVHYIGDTPSAEFIVRLPENFRLADDLSAANTQTQSDVLLTEDGCIVVIPMRNVARIVYIPIPEPA